jgi:hypothetical protein
MTVVALQTSFVQGVKGESNLLRRLARLELKGAGVLIERAY